MVSIGFFKNISENKIKLTNTVNRKTSPILLKEIKQDGIDIDKNAIQRIECGKRFVTDIELSVFAKVFNVDYKDLLE